MGCSSRTPYRCNHQSRAGHRFHSHSYRSRQRNLRRNLPKQMQGIRRIQALSHPCHSCMLIRPYILRMKQTHMNHRRYWRQRHSCMPKKSCIPTLRILLHPLDRSTNHHCRSQKHHSCTPFRRYIHTRCLQSSE